MIRALPVLATLLALGAAPHAEAATARFDARIDASLRLVSVGSGSLDDPGWVSSVLQLHVGAQSKEPPNIWRVVAEDQKIDKEGTAVPLGPAFGEGRSLFDLVFAEHTDATSGLSRASASPGAEARADSRAAPLAAGPFDIDPAGLSATTEISGSAWEIGSASNARAKFSLDLHLRNLSDAPLEIRWDLDAHMTASASVDDPRREDAFARGMISFAVGDAKPTRVEIGAEAPTRPGDDGLPGKPPALVEVFEIVMLFEPGQTQRLQIALENFGTARVIPVPPALPLLAGGLLLLGTLARRRRG